MSDNEQLKSLDKMPMFPLVTETEVKTFRGRTLEGLLPQIKQELGPDAIVLRRREGLAGGVGGFFQRSFVEVEARRALPGELEGGVRNDRATAEGLRAPAIQALVEQASPFADALSRADGSVADRASDVLLAAARGSALATAPAGLYGPQPAAPDDVAAPALDDDVAEVVTRQPPRYDSSELAAIDAAPAHQIAAPPEVLVAPPVAPGRPTAADAAEQRLVAAGLSAGLAADIVGEAVAHGLPFAQPRGFKKLVRTALARRLPVMADLGPDRRVIAVAGAGGAGKTALVGKLAAAYAAADHEVVVVALDARDGGCAVAAALEPLGVSVIAAADAAQAARRLRHREPLITLVDTPALGAGDARAATALARRLPGMADLGPDRRVIAVAGAGGAGKTALVGKLVAAYAAADHEVVVVALDARDGGCAVAAALEPLGVSVIAAADAAQAARRLRHREPLITLVDTPALGAGDARAATALAPELRALGCTEVHLALPATVSAAAADEISAALAPLGITHLALTQADQTARPGAPLELAVRTRRPLSYVATRDDVAPADPASLAAQLLP